MTRRCDRPSRADRVAFVVFVAALTAAVLIPLYVWATGGAK